jgi:dihydroorotate dehydrogenase electron transfer subunit
VKQVNAVVKSSELLCYDPDRKVYLVWAHAPEIAAAARPGQYVMVRCGEGQDMLLRRPLSVNRISQDGSIALLFAIVGRGTEWLAQRNEGDRIDLFGPLGNGFEIAPSSKNLLLVAGGIGIAPLVALGGLAVTMDKSVTLLIGDTTVDRIYPDHLLPAGVEAIIATEDGSAGEMGMATDLLPRYVPEADQVFVCGPLPMYRKIAGMGDVLGAKPVQVILETVLGCGVGACLGCTVETVHGPRLVCKDGPVFELRDIVWEKAVAPDTREALLKRRLFRASC